jgi:uncharacterized membrane protein YsdA (DUF1294 family)/cold shock CspA family protein
MRFRGQVAKWKDDEGYGFIVPAGQTERVFFHIKDVENRSVRPAEQDLVTFEIARDDKNRLRAAKVQYQSASKHGRGLSRAAIFASMVAFASLSLLAVAALLGMLSAWVPAVFAACSLILYLVYGYDKSQAESGGWRVSESALHVLALAGGWPGALVAQRVMRHKVSKPSFMVAYWSTVGVNCLALGLYFLLR